jgi:hypothetical protein
MRAQQEEAQEFTTETILHPEEEEEADIEGCYELISRQTTELIDQKSNAACNVFQKQINHHHCK